MSHPYLMIKILSEKKKFPVSCTHGRMCAFGRYAPEIKKLLPYLSSFIEPDESEPAVIKNAEFPLPISFSLNLAFHGHI